MTYLVAAQTVVLVLLVILMAGLLRSHAETLRRLPPEQDEGAGGWDAPTELQIVAPPEREADELPATDVSGATLEGDAVKIALGRGAPHTLLAFLSSGCATCASFWHALQADRREPLPGDARPVVVTKDSAYESPSKLRELAPSDIPVVMSSVAWEDYSVPVAPYFVYVGADGQVLGEGAANNWGQITSLFRDALLDLELSAPEPADTAPHRAAEAPGTREQGAGEAQDGSRARPDRAGERLDGEDDTLAAAGIRPGHPSLYPAEREREQG